MEHLTPDELEALVGGFADEVSEARRRHLATCGRCARALAREARLELDLHGAFPARAGARDEAAARPSPWTFWRVALQAAAALAIVAAAIRFLAPQPGAPPVPAAVTASVPASPDTPCLVDPRGLGPGYDVVSPGEMCRNIMSPPEPGLAL